MWIFIVNALLYFLTFGFYFAKDRKLSIRAIVFLIYTVFACASIYAINIGIYFDAFGSFSFNSLSLTPYILNYLLVLLMAQGLQGLRSIKYDAISLNNKFIFFFELSIIALSLIYMVFQYMWNQLFSEVDLVDIYEAGHSWEQDYVFPDPLWNVIYFRSQQLLAFATPLIYIIEFMNLALNKNTFKSMTIILLIFAPKVLGCGMAGNRGGIVFAFASLAFFIMFFWPKLSAKLKRTIVVGGLAMILFGGIYLAAISFSRAGDDSEKAVESAIRYFGESFPNLGWNIWAIDGSHLEGMRMYPTLYDLFGGGAPEFEAEGVGGMQYYYEIISRWPILIFKTFFGDMYVEFGPVIPFVIVLLYLAMAYGMQKALKNSVFSLLIVHFTFMVLIWGLFDSYLTQDNLISLILTFFVAVWLNKILSKRLSASEESALKDLSTK